MSACNAKWRAADQHTRPWDIASIDGVAKSNVGVTICPYIAHRRNACFERHASVVRTNQGLARYGECQGFVAKVWIGGEMGVRVNQTGQDGRIRQVDRAIAGRSFDRRNRTDAHDLVAFDDDGLVRLHSARFYVKQLARVYNRPLAGCLGGNCGRECQQNQNH
jgi:hypothetical protein